MKRSFWKPLAALFALAFAWVAGPLFAEPNHAPHVLVIGDSVAIYKGPLNVEGWANSLEPFRVTMSPNAGTSRSTRQFVEQWLVPADIILWNNGIHDTRRPNAHGRPNTVPVDEYRNNLLAVGRRLLETGARVYWINTTPVSPAFGKAPDVMGINPDDIVVYNAIARSVMKELGIPVIDLNRFCRHKLGLYNLADGVHWKPEASRRQARFIVERLEADLREHPLPGPMPPWDASGRAR